jgi:hypothetical protein
MDNINLMNYKLIYEHLDEIADNLGQGTYTGEAGQKRLEKACQQRDRARHLYIRKMKTFLAQEKATENSAHLDCDINIDNESYLLTT